MAHNFALQPLLELMQERTDEASRRLGQLIAAEQNSRQQLSMLEEYRNEYVERLRQATQAGTTRQIIANYQEFLRRIEEAIEQQTKRLSQVTDAFAARRMDQTVKAALAGRNLNEIEE